MKSPTDKLTLEVQKRAVFGKKLNAVRRQGFLPGNIFGANIQSQAITCAAKDFTRLFKKAGVTQIVHLKLDTQELPVLIASVQKHPISHLLLHVDFRNVDLTKKIETEVPVKLIGESPAVAQNKGVLLTLAESLLVEALPDSIPANIEIDISRLHAVNDEIKVKEMKITGEYIFKDDPEKVIVRISEHKEESVETQVVAPETVEVTTEKKEETTTEEGEKDAKSEKPAESAGKPTKEETKKEEKK